MGCEVIDGLAGRLYAEAGVNLDYVGFVAEHGIPDVFLSWFHTTFLHIWYQAFPFFSSTHLCWTISQWTVLFENPTQYRAK